VGCLMALINNSKSVKESKAIVEQTTSFSFMNIKKFILEVKTEASKIVWPEKKITMSLTAVVVILSTIISIYLGTVDFILGKLISSFLN
jgi:preprotein translocase subunit SecE